MSEYGGCTLSFCNWMDDPYEPNYCENCPYYDPNLFKEMEENNANTSNQGQR